MISISSKTTGLPLPSRHHRAFCRRSVAVTPSIALDLAPSIACRRHAVHRRRAAAAATPPPRHRQAATAKLPPPSHCRTAATAADAAASTKPRRAVLLPPPLRRRQAAANGTMSRCHHCRSHRAAATVLPPLRCAPTSQCRAAATAADAATAAALPPSCPQRRALRECLAVACKAFSLANAKGKGTNGLTIRSLD